MKYETWLTENERKLILELINEKINAMNLALMNRFESGKEIKSFHHNEASTMKYLSKKLENLDGE